MVNLNENGGKPYKEQILAETELDVCHMDFRLYIALDVCDATKIISAQKTIGLCNATTRRNNTIGVCDATKRRKNMGTKERNILIVTHIYSYLDS